LWGVWGVVCGVLTPVWSALGDALGALIAVDEAVTQNDTLGPHAAAFLRLLRAAGDTGEEAATEGGARLLQRLETGALSGGSYTACVQQEFDHRPSGILARENATFQLEFFVVLQAQVAAMGRTPASLSDVGRQRRAVSVCGLYGLYVTLYPEKARKDSDHKKLFRHLWDSHRKAPVVHLGGATTFSPCDWLLRRAGDVATAVLKDAAKDAHAIPREALATAEAAFPGHVARLAAELLRWVGRVESAAAPTGDDSDAILGVGALLLLQGLQLASEVSHLLHTLLLLHLQLGRPLSTAKALLLCKCAEILKAIEAEVGRMTNRLAILLPAIYATSAADVERVLLPLCQKLRDKTRKLDDAQAGQLYALDVALRALDGPPTASRLTVLRLALSLATMKASGPVSESDLEEARGPLRRLEALASHQRLLREACDCSILYWVRSLLPIYLQSVFAAPESVPSLRLMVAALHDVAPLLLRAPHLPDPSTLLTAYAKEVQLLIASEVLEPAQKEIEDDLRLHIHAVVLGQDAKDFKRPSPRDLRRLTAAPPMPLFGETLHLKVNIEHYLDRQFYNLSAISQHDWRTYEELRVLAREKYGLNLMEVYLPGANLEQGLDVLEVTRNIRLFVARYSYNLNNQLFLEKPTRTDAQNLHTIHIRHVANSIRTHGPGFMDSAVNFVYQFLGKQLHVFSQFLYDDHVKSRLIRDWRGFVETKAECGGRYPVKRGERFVKYLRKLPGQSPEAGFLDLFRNLMTEIGNALGYVRMVRSGGLRFMVESVKFVPDLGTESRFGALAEESGLQPSTVQAARQVDEILGTLKGHLAEGADYFGLLERVFAEEVQKEHNQHLKNFFVIIPPLTLSFVDHMLAAKDRASQKGKEAFAFTDDGFALGVAFVLKLLRQYADFDSLHWFASVEDHYRAHLEELAADQKRGRRDPPAAPTLRLTRARVEAAMREFELLFYAFRSCRVFFAEGAEDLLSQEEEDRNEAAATGDGDEGEGSTYIR